MSSTLVVFTNATPGMEQEFNAWYNDIHLPEVLALPGFVSAKRLKLSDAQLPADATEPCSFGYLALYELECEPSEAFATLMEEVGTGRMVLPECIDQTKIGTWAFDTVAELAQVAS